MKKSLFLVLLVGFISSVLAKDVVFDFESEKKGDIPQNWECVSNWEIEEDNKAHSGKYIFSMKENKKGFFGFGRSFNLCFSPKTSFLDGEASVKFRANSGSIDQGGGIIWRVQDKNNYYVARFNPLEDNFRFYKVLEGNRIQLKSAEINLSNGWHEMKIVQKGNHFEGYLDGKKLLEADDNSIVKKGAVGIWTKADAATSFDDLLVRVEQ